MGLGGLLIGVESGMVNRHVAVAPEHDRAALPAVVMPHAAVSCCPDTGAAHDSMIDLGNSSYWGGIDGFVMRHT